MKRTAIIMAGGTGERFWPLSRRSKPKQLLPLTGEKTMLELSIERILPIIDAEDIIVVTSRLLLEPVRSALSIIPPENVIAEPCKRNTAPCLALGAAFISEKYRATHSSSEISVSVLTADHSITPINKFTETVSAVLDYVESNPALAVIGIPPSRPETGFGYIEFEKSFSEDKSAIEIQPVMSFREKPQYGRALEYIQSGHFLWNSGMFFWRLDTFINEMKAWLPEIGNHIEAMSDCFRNKTQIALPEPLGRLSPIFEPMPNISIDYGLLEKAKCIIAARAIFDWDDLGSWDSLERLNPKDEHGNIVSGNCSITDTKNSIIINNSTDRKIIFSCLGIRDMVIVVTDDAVLTLPRDRVQELRTCVDKIRRDGGDKWL